jgi:hypothetical protein
MKIFSPVLKGTTTSDGTSNLSGSFTGSLSGTSATASYVVSSVTDATQNTRLQTLESVTGSYASTSSLATSNTRITTIEAVTGSFTLTSSFGTYTSSNDTTNTTQNARLLSNEQKTGSFATTGSNFFIGNQVITGSVYIANDLIVQGSSSLQNITASAVSIGTNRVILNTATPILQFGGISVFDSGSTQGRSGSLLWNSINDHWINVNPSGSDEGYNSAMVINGPKNTGSLGNEAGLTLNYIPVSQGEDHITDSIIFQSGSVNIGIGTTTPSAKLDVNGTGRFSSTGRTLTVVSTNDAVPAVIRSGLGAVSTLSFQGTTSTNDFNTRIGCDGNDLVAFTSNDIKFRIASGGAATFSGSVTIRDGLIMNSFESLLHTQNGTLSYYSSTNAVYLNGAGPSGWLRLNAAGSENDRNSINIFGSTASSPDIINFKTANATRLTISNTGVSTFTTTENQGGLYVTSATDNTTIRVASTATGGQEWRLQSTGGSSGLGQGKLIFKVGGTETAFNIPLTLTTDNSTNGGRVGIGSTNPLYKLEVNGTATTDFRIVDSGDVGFQMTSGGTSNAFSIRTNGSTVIMSTSNSRQLNIGVNASTGDVLGSTTGMSITSGGNVTVAGLLAADRLSLTSFPTLYGTKVVKADAVTSASFNLATMFPEISSQFSGGNVVGVFGRYTVFRSGAAETGIFSISRNSSSTWSSASYGTQTATGAYSLSSIAGSSTSTLTFSFNTTVYTMIEITVMIE